MYLAYSLVFTLGLLLAAPYYLWHYRGNRLPKGYFRERLGLLPASLANRPAAGERSAVWIHAVSLGETLAVAALAREIQRLHPGHPVFMSNITPAGRKASEARLTGLAGRFYLPLDWKWALRRVLRRLQPAVLLIVETELWPNLLGVAREFGTRTVVVNGRLSERSFRGYRRLRPLVRRVLQNLDLILAQSPADAARYCALGASPDRVAVTGNLKFDGFSLEPAPVVARLEAVLKGASRGPVVVAGSTMPGEESLVLRAWREILARHPRALLVVAPRHPARFESVAEMLASQNEVFVRRTALETDSTSPLATAPILLLNTIGELAGVFKLADVVFMGGSLVPTGGHNLLEPAFWSKPILFGPHMENFRDAAEMFLEGHAARQVDDAAGLARATLELLGDAEARRTMGRNAKRLLEREAGATARTLERLRPWIEANAPVPPGSEAR